MCIEQWDKSYGNCSLIFRVTIILVCATLDLEIGSVSMIRLCWSKWADRLNSITIPLCVCAVSYLATPEGEIGIEIFVLEKP